MSASAIEPRHPGQLRRTQGELDLNIRDVDTHAIGLRAQRWIVKRTGLERVSNDLKVVAGGRSITRRIRLSCFGADRPGAG